MNTRRHHPEQESNEAIAPAGTAGFPDQSAEERHRMAECCAFFMAEQFREAGPGQIRRQDIELAETQIEAIFRRCCRG